MQQTHRTHYAAECQEELVGQTVTLNGWVQRRRDLGDLIFVDLRDRSGTVQIVFNANVNKESFITAESVRSEYVISVVGTVIARDQKTINPKMPTGKVEISADQITVLNVSQPLPIPINSNVDADDNVRLKYRYLDLRRDKMKKVLIIRHKAMQSMRQFLDGEDFLEVETPLLTKSTPEGARDYLVPSRLHKGSFYALPQSPQLFKQLLMVAGVERYFQFAKCFRDEDLRADRQPEFTQVDIEASFMPRDLLLDMIERMMVKLFKDVINTELTLPFERYTYQEAIDLYGSDKPDLRFDMQLVDLSSHLVNSSCTFFANVIASGDKVKAIKAPGCAAWSRKEIADFIALAESYGAEGLSWLAFKSEGLRGPHAKQLSLEDVAAIQRAVSAEVHSLK